MLYVTFKIYSFNLSRLNIYSGFYEYIHIIIIITIGRFHIIDSLLQTDTIYSELFMQHIDYNYTYGINNLNYVQKSYY